MIQYMAETESVQVNKNTLERLRMHVAIKNGGKTYRLLGDTFTTAIDEYLDRRSAPK